MRKIVFCLCTDSYLLLFLVVLAVISAEGCLKPEMAEPDFVKTPEPKDFVSNDQLPKEYDP